MNRGFLLPLYHMVSLWFSVSAVLRFQEVIRSRLGFTSFFYIVSFKETRPPVKPGGSLLWEAKPAAGRQWRVIL